MPWCLPARYVRLILVDPFLTCSDGKAQIMIIAKEIVVFEWIRQVPSSEPDSIWQSGCPVGMCLHRPHYHVTSLVAASEA